MKYSRRVLGFALATVAVVSASEKFVVDKENALGFYRDFTRLTNRPHLVAPLTAALCTIPSQAVVEQEKQKTGPHYKASVHLYANPVAMSAITTQTPAFAVGSVIVKEKLAEAGKIAGVGGMIKREAGYDESNGDWEYFYYGKPGEFSSGRIVSCIECHRAAKATDYVYSVWSLPK